MMQRFDPESAPKGVCLLVAGGIAMKKTGGQWFSVIDGPMDHRPLSWEPNWWAHIPNDNEPISHQEAIDHLKGGWRPIETAPEDQDILVYTSKTKSYSIARSAGFNSWFGLCDGETVTDGGDEFHWDYIMVQPTHWMPLPEAPEAE